MEVRMKLRQMATAFIEHNGKMALMKKERNKLFDFEFWTGLGGHMEHHELNNPREACIREIFKESKLQKEDLIDLTLRYILLRQKEDEIRIQYVYFGRTEQSELVSSDEGELYWIDARNVLDLKISTIIRKMLEHYWENRNETHLFVGTITKSDECETSMQWSIMEDPMVF
jgi:8-oxo-dGTP diphosphatase